MDVLEVLGCLLAGLVLLYMAARFIFTAYFKTKQDFERKNQNGKK